MIQKMGEVDYDTISAVKVCSEHSSEITLEALASWYGEFPGPLDSEDDMCGF